MTSESLKEKFFNIGINVVQVEGSADKDDGKGLVVVGNLEEYCSALKSMGVNFVFLVIDQLEEEDFEYSTGSFGVEDDSDDEDNSAVDLVKILPTLKKFKSYIGQQCRFKLSALMPSCTLDYYEREVWWEEFEQLWSDAVATVDEEANQEEAASQAEQDKMNQKLIKSVKALINDKDFLCLPTQRAMVEYAKDNIADLEDLDSSIIKDEIKTLDAKIKARGLSRKP